MEEEQRDPIIEHFEVFRKRGLFNIPLKDVLCKIISFYSNHDLLKNAIIFPTALGKSKFHRSLSLHPFMFPFKKKKKDYG